MRKITPCLWFDNNCEEAVNFYVNTFPNAKIKSIMRHPADLNAEPHMPELVGKILTAEFNIGDYDFQALDGGSYFKINPSISFMVNFDPSKDQDAAANLDKLWEKLSEGGKVMMPLQEYPFSKRYGWIEDRFGVSWQLILTDPNGEPRPFIMPSMLFVNEVCGRAEEALNYYVSVFKDSKLGTIAKYPAGMDPDKEGTVMFGEANLSGEWLIAMDSAHKHDFKFTEGVSLSVLCEDQAEVDYFWDKLSEGGDKSQCGWVKDKFNVSWQIVPRRLGELLGDVTDERSKRTLEAMMGMNKLDIAALEAAYAGN